MNDSIKKLIKMEAAELLEIFQWSGSDTAVDTEKKMAKVQERSSLYG